MSRNETSLEEDLKARLEASAAQNLDRHLATARGLDLSSNDYLGLSRDPGLLDDVRRRLEKADAIGAPASRLLRGHTELHERLEARFAAFQGTEASLLFPSGWQANVAMITSLVGPRDVVLSDELNHASLIDALRLSGARKLIYPHLGVDAIDELLTAAEGHRKGRRIGRVFLVTESLYSMDGDVAPLDRYAELCREHGAELLVDDAHATGLWGERGSGLVEHFGVVEQCAAIMSTCGKALGLSGAFVATSETLRRWMIQSARPFVFSTAVPPLLLHALDAALDRVESEPERRRRVLALADDLRRRLRDAGLHVPSEEGPIVPVILGAAETALAVADALRDAGFDVRAIRPPTVPEGTSRLRLSIHADHREDDLERLAEHLVRAAEELRAEDQRAEEHGGD